MAPTKPLRPAAAAIVAGIEAPGSPGPAAAARQEHPLGAAGSPGTSWPPGGSEGRTTSMTCTALTRSDHS